MKKLWNDLLNLFYPNLCKLCRRLLIDGENQICISCLCNLPRTGFHKEEDNPVRQLLQDREKLTTASAFLYYEKGGKVQQLIHSIKYYDNKELGYLLGRQAALELKAADHPLSYADILLPLPLYYRKERQRGYNQSEWIAKGIQSVWETPVLNNAVKRIIHTESQTSKISYNRWLNVKNIFSVVNPEPLSGKHILLIDDVVTSGSTAGACIDTLSAIADIRISFFSLSIAKH